MKFHRSATVLVTLVTLGGCTGLKGKDASLTTPPGRDQRYAGYGFDDLLSYARDLAELPAADRLAECQQVLQLYRTNRSLALGLRLLLAETVTEACGDIRDATAIAEAALSELADQRLQSLLIYQKEILARIEREKNQRKALERRVSETAFKQKKAHRLLKSQESELKQLQEKLDALKAIEQSLDEPNDGQ
jgi:hypothetical protein